MFTSSIRLGKMCDLFDFNMVFGATQAGVIRSETVDLRF